MIRRIILDTSIDIDGQNWYHQNMKTFGPLDTRKLTEALNVSLGQQVNGYFNLIPLRILTEVINVFGLDASKIVDELRGDKGRLNVHLAQDIFLALTWERMETGRFEIIAYASSTFDDYREPFTAVYSTQDKNKRARKLGIALGKLPTYMMKGNAFAAIVSAIQDAGFDYYEFQDSTLTAIGDEGHLLVPVYQNGKQVVGVFVSWYRMPSGNYEINSYVS